MSYFVKRRALALIVEALDRCDCLSRIERMTMTLDGHHHAKLYIEMAGEEPYPTHVVESADQAC